MERHPELTNRQAQIISRVRNEVNVESITTLHGTVTAARRRRVSGRRRRVSSAVRVGQVGTEGAVGQE